MKCRYYCYRHFIWTLLLVAVAAMQWSCKKAVEVSPPTTELVSATVYSTDVSAEAAVTGIFQEMLERFDFFGPANAGKSDFTTIAGLSADEFSLYPNAIGGALLQQVYTNALQSSDVPFWQYLYKCVYLANAAIAGLQGSTALTPSVKQQLLGEALFVRAFCNFYLVNVFGNVPLVTVTNYQTNEALGQSSSTLVYQQVVADLTTAQSYLSSSFVDITGAATTERTLPNQEAAEAFLARVYLYMGKYDSAVIESTLVIGNSNYALVGLDSVFLMNSQEAIWQLVDVNKGYNTPDGYTYILTAGPNTSNNPVYLSPWLLRAFEVGDRRMAEWVGVDNAGGTSYYFPYKYKVKGGPASTPVSEYYMMFRLGEQYLIRAEAEANTSDLTDAAADMNVIRTRAGLANISSTIASSQSALLTAILHERQVELFCEWGHRWLDLVRTNTAGSVLGAPGNVCAAKGGTWATTAELFPIPLSEIEADVNLTQNPGYN
jgi:starch-binding outer membrane protein, SusD/RagB family